MILPFEHIRVFRRKGVIKPILMRQSSGILDTLMEVYRDHVGKKRGSLIDIVEDCEYLGYNYKLVRGLSSVLDGRSRFHPRNVIPPLDARRQVFREAANQSVINEEKRTTILRRVAKANKVSINEIEDSLYADLESEQYLESFNDLTPTDLSMYYNYAITVALLAYSTQLQLSYRGGDARLREIFYDIGVEKPNHGSLKVVGLKPTRRLSQRASKIDDFLSRLLETDGWFLRADVKYPPRYKSTCVLEIDSKGDGRLLKTEPPEEELIIEIPDKEKPLKYGEIVVLDEVAERMGVTKEMILKEIQEEGGEYNKIGGLLVVPELYEMIKEELTSIETLGEARKYFKGRGVRDFIQAVECFGYQIRWETPREKSKLYHL